MKRSWFVIFSVALLLSIVVDLVLPAGKADKGFWWSHIRGFFALFGFLGCVAIVAVAKLIGHYWLQRKEDYYD